MTEVIIHEPGPSEVEGLPQMQVAAGALFRELGMDLVAQGPAPPLEDFRQARAAHRLLVAYAQDVVVGFVCTRPLDGALHVEQVTVSPDWQGRGIGRALMLGAETLAADHGLGRMTLTTFRDVPFNGPFYHRLGWAPLDEAGLTPGLLAERRSEIAAGLDQWPRLAMAKATRSAPRVHDSG